MVKVAGFCLSLVALLAGSAAAQSTKHSADPHAAIATGHNGQPCIPSPISANKVLTNVAPANVKPHSTTVNPDVYGVAKPIVIADPPPDNPPTEPGVTDADPPGKGPGGGPTGKPPSSQPASSQAPTGAPSCPNHH